MIAFVLIVTLIPYWAASLIQCVWYQYPDERWIRDTNVRVHRVVDDVARIVLGICALVELWWRFSFGI